MEQRVRTEARRKESAGEIFGMIAVTAAIFAVVLTGAFGGVKRVIQAPAFAQGTVINGVDISGLALAEGNRRILEYDGAQLDKIEIRILYNGAEALLRATDLGVSTDAEQALLNAYVRNKQGETAADFDRSQEPFHAQTQFIINDARLKKSVTDFLTAQDIPARDAQAIFDAQARSFTYTPEQNGIEADADAVCELVKTKLLKRDYTPLALSGGLTRNTYASITKSMLRENTVPIGKCITLASNNENRNINIQLMCDAVDGLVIMPGETLSLNGLVGRRTEEKGFRAAPSIVDGQLADDIGGGICQLAGTLYNAALYADMEIVERVHHTWPSEYLPVGRDATLNWDNKDLKIKNSSQYPVYISAQFKTLVLDVALFGAPPPDGVEIDLETVLVREIEAPESEIIYTDKLPVGAVRTKIKGRKGYEVITYRHYLKDGEIVKSDVISRDHFRAVRGTMFMGTNEIIK